jgi:SNF2 family DNA or RNA helicase
MALSKAFNTICDDQLLRASHRWGLTATPEAKFQQITSLLWGCRLDRRTFLRVRAPWAAQRVRRDPPSECLQLPELQQRMVPVDLSEHERSIVDLHCQAGSTIDRCVRLVNYFDEDDTDVAGSDSDCAVAFLSLDDWAEHTRETHQSRLDKTRERLEYARENLQETEERGSHFASEKGSRQQDWVEREDAEESANLRGQEIFDEFEDEHMLLQTEIANLEGQCRQEEADIAFVEATQRFLRSPNAECAVCMEPLAAKPVTVLLCLHAFDGHCIDSICKQRSDPSVTCPLCRTVTKRSEMSVFFNGRLAGAKADPERRQSESRQNSESAEQAVSRGSKLTALVQMLTDILDQSNRERIVVFAQFSGLLSALSSALIESGIENSLLVGPASKRLSLLQEFQAGRGPRVLLLGYRANASGINLDAAQHVVLVHPFCGSNCPSVDHVQMSEAVAYETQAVGRVLRHPQLKPVTVYRLYARSTVEAELYSMFGWKETEEGETSRQERLQINLGSGH